MWSLYEKEKELKPLKFSNGKTQEDVVNDILEAIKQGNKIIFIKGVCGSGKSIIALNLAKELGKASIVVPSKTLQKQYEDDYSERKYLVKNNREKLKIKIIKGRQNFSCPFMKANRIIEEENLTLDAFSDDKRKTRKDNSCNNAFLPCKIEIKEKNFETIKNYLKQNKKLSGNLSLKDVRRMSIAPICEHWSPISPIEMPLNLDNAELRVYTGLKNKKYVFYRRKDGCDYCQQYNSYLDADVIIFNSEKYKIETLMDRKPATEIEIIDECDEFLDSFANSGMININRLNYALGMLFSDNYIIEKEINELIKLTKEILNENMNIGLEGREIPIQETKILSLLEKFLDTELMSYVECDEENYCYHVEETAKNFNDLFDETFVFFEKLGKDLIVKLVTINLGKRFKEMLDKNKIFVLMSGTIHSEKVLKEIFGLENFKIVEAEMQMPGKISKFRTGLEVNCKHENFKNWKVTREQYLSALSKCIEQAIKPVLIHVNAFSDLPNEKEAEKFPIIMTREQLKEMQKDAEKNIKKFKDKEIKILYSTKCNRGVDFPGDVCNSIILTKYPYPDISNPFWKLLKKVHPDKYNSFYMDKAKREFSQRIYRGLRFKEDHIYLLSPDIRVFEKI